MTDRNEIAARLRAVAEKHGLMYADLDTVTEAAEALAAPKGGVDDARRLDFIAGIWSKGLTPQLAAVIEAFRAGDSETIRATIDAAIAAQQAEGEDRG